jgi:phosphate transport system permease protein
MAAVSSSEVLAASAARSNQALVAKKLGARHRSEILFQALGLGAIAIGIAFVIFLFGSILYKGIPAFTQATIHLDINFDPGVLEIPPRPVQTEGVSGAEQFARLNEWKNKVSSAEWNDVLQLAVARAIPEAAEDRRAALGLISDGERYRLAEMVEEDPALLGSTQRVALLTPANVDVWLKGNIDRSLPDKLQAVPAKVREWADRLYASGVITMDFSTVLFTNTDASVRQAASAGLLGAIVGSVMMMAIVLVFAVPIGVAAAIYLEEFAPKNRWTDFIEVNINNLAAVPSIVFGLLGAAVFIGFLDLPRSAPIVGGLVLSLMTLPTVIIATRASLRAVPPSIRQAALGVGASPMQAMFHHTLPLAVPGILTGAIIGIAHAIGETAPLLLIGMKAVVQNVPTTPFEQSSALPVQIFLWQGSELRNFFEGRTAAAIIVLLAVMILLNSIAIILRHRFERRW